MSIVKAKALPIFGLRSNVPIAATEFSSGKIKMEELHAHVDDIIFCADGR